MKRVILSFLVLCAFCGAGAAQQPNGFAASLIVNGFMGPPYPVAGVSLPIGLPATVSIGASTPNVPYLLFGASDLVAGPGTPVPGVGLIDIDLASGPFVILDGFATPAGNPYDLPGAVLNCLAIAPGTPAAQFYVN